MKEYMKESIDVEAIEFFPQKERIEIDIRLPKGTAPFFKPIYADKIAPFGWKLIQPAESLNFSRIDATTRISKVDIVTVQNTEPPKNYVIHSHTGDFTEDIGCEVVWNGGGSQALLLSAPYYTQGRCECKFWSVEPLHGILCTKKPLKVKITQ